MTILIDIPATGP